MPEARKPAMSWRQWVYYTIAVVLSSLVTGLVLRFTGQRVDVPTPPLILEVEKSPIIVGCSGEVPEDIGERPVYYTGWVNDPDLSSAVAARQTFRVFGDTPAGQIADPLPDHVYLWQCYEKLFARPPPSKNQRQVGSCVAFATNNAIERTMAFEIAILRQPKTFKHICEEVTYGGGRVEVGGGRISGDGLVGAWAAEFAKKWGVVPREKVLDGKYDLSSYSESRCRDWGRRGVPDDLEPLARENPVKDIVLVKTWEEAKKSLAQGYAIAVCSNQGFDMRRDERGIARPIGSWAHSMCLDGYHIENGREYGHIENSWGENAHTGPVGWGNPPPSGFWADSSVIARMLHQDDSWAFAGTKGFPARKVDWTVDRRDWRRADPPMFVFARFNP